MANPHLIDAIAGIISKIIKPFTDIHSTLSGFVEGIVKGLHKTFVEDTIKKFEPQVEKLQTVMENLGKSVNLEDIWHSPAEFENADVVAKEKQTHISGETLKALILGSLIEMLNPLSQGSVPHFLNVALTTGGSYPLCSGYWNTYCDRVLFTPMRYALNNKFLPEYLSYTDLLGMRSRFIISNEDFLTGMMYHGIRIGKGLITPTDWYSESSILEHFDDPTKWEKIKVTSWGDALLRLCGEPAGYFLLSMASRTGYYDEEVFKKALLDSNYGSLAMGIALQAFRKAFLRRWLTKYEDGAIEEFLAGDIDEREFHDRLISLEYTEDVATIFTKFFKNRRDETRRKAVIAVYRKAYQRGKISKDEFKRYLLGKGYDLDSIDLIIDIADEEIVGEKFLTKAEIVKLYKHDLITDKELKTRFLNIYADKDEADLAYRLEKKLKEGGAV